MANTENYVSSGNEHLEMAFHLKKSADKKKAILMTMVFETKAGVQSVGAHLSLSLFPQFPGCFGVKGDFTRLSDKKINRRLKIGHFYRFLS